MNYFLNQKRVNAGHRQKTVREENVLRFAAPKVFRCISDPRSRKLAALRADSWLEKGRSPPRPLRPLGSGGTDSALRLVTCWSSDVLRLSSLGQTGRKSSNQADIDAFVAGEDYYKGWFFWQWYEF